MSDGVLLDRSSVATTGNIGGKKLIQDIMPLKVLSNKDTVVESATGIKRNVKRLGGQFQYADRPNANGRIYGRKVLEEAIKALQPEIKARRVLGELDHPADAKIHMDRVSHLVTKLWMESNGAVFGELEILRGTIMGDQLAALVDNQVTVGISSRGAGDLEEVEMNGQVYQSVAPGYTLVTFDVVGEPSVGGSFLSVLESKQKQVQQKKIVTKKDAEKMVVSEFKQIFGKNNETIVESSQIKNNKLKEWSVYLNNNHDMLVSVYGSDVKNKINHFNKSIKVGNLSEAKSTVYMLNKIIRG